MNSQPPSEDLGTRNHWRRVLWVVVFIVLVLVARRVAGAADAWQAADSLLKEGKTKEAAAAYEKLLRQKPDNARAFMGRGRARWRLGDLDGAIADFTRVTQLTPNDASAYNNRALAHDNKGQRDLALADYSKAIELNPKDALFYYNRALTWSAVKEPDKALADYTAAIELDPKNGMFYAYRAELLLNRGEYEKAVADCDKAIALNETYAAAYFNRATAYDQMGEKERVLADYDKAVELAPKVAKFHNNRGFYLMNRGDNEAAIESFDKALELIPEGTIYLNNRGQAWLNLGQQEMAMADFDKALQINPKHARAYRNRAGGWLAAGEFQKAVADATKCLELLPTETRALQIRGEAREALGDSAGAKEDLERSTILGPQPPVGVAAWVPVEIKTREEQAMKALLEDASLENRHTMAVVRHDHAFAILDHPQRELDKAALEEAVGYARSASALEPGNAAHLFLTGLLYQELAEFDERALVMAEKMFTQAVEVDAEHAAAWLELGLMMAAQDRGMEAISALEHALESDPAASASHAVGPLCAEYAANDEGYRGVDFFEEQYAANPEVTALGVGHAIMLNYLGDRAAALSEARDILLIEEAGTPEHDYAAKLVAEWEGEKP
ncbi:MAG: tetratricopeptide repeat protein [Prosthecobacter sp.]|uniref:tetratricopeptide repeat protein n=1 Tax=Prosthecobacter sp. TaxID=1965333 RepID=UPI00261B1E95|nr:tetratricopeptide repeat protein [Prosthecobacter sp.]MCF7789867.1 tetratricopeptide repeat protein [Prosthecobacter sp.]